MTRNRRRKPLRRDRKRGPTEPKEVLYRPGPLWQAILDGEAADDDVRLAMTLPERPPEPKP